MKLVQLLEYIPYEVLTGSTEVEIARLARDNRDVKAGDLFICIRGARFDTHNCVAQIAEKAAAVVVERQVDIPADCKATVILVPDTRKAEAFLEAAYYGHPAEKMVMIGVTGSKGKTTTTHMLADILRADGHKVGTIGTNGAIIGDKIYELTNTTPAACDIQMYLSMMVKEGCDVAVVECSSQGLMQHRVGGFTFDYGIFTNISTGDHIGPNEHKDFDDYLYCKGMLIRNSKMGFVNQDDPFTAKMLETIHTPVKTFGRQNTADYYATGFGKTFEEGEPGIEFDVNGLYEDHIQVNFPGEFNVGNAMAAISVAHHMKASPEAIKYALTHMKITGRIDMVYRSDKFSVCVDFAHNGYSTRNLLEALREYRPKRLVCVFGADGNRSKHRRYEMGEASGRLADLSIITSGHNRWETFEAILKDIHVGLDKTTGSYIIIPDRKEAVRYAIEHAQEGDVITIIGLGHEHYQEENGIMYPYSDTEYVLGLIEELKLDNK